MKTRLDAELVRRGLARSRDNAIDLIDSGQVLVNGIPASKAASQVDAQISITLKDDHDVMHWRPHGASTNQTLRG